MIFRTIFATYDCFHLHDRTHALFFLCISVTFSNQKPNNVIEMLVEMFVAELVEFQK